MRRSHLVRAAALLVPAVAAACGTGTVAKQGGASAPSPRAAVLASLQHVQGTSYHFTMHLSMTGLGSAGGALNDAFTETGAYSAGQRALDATISSSQLKSNAGEAFRAIFFLRSNTAYISLAAGGKWYEISGAGTGLAGFGSLIGSFDSDSPLGYLGTVNGAVTGVRPVGTKTVDGVTTTEYAVSENLRSVLDKLLSSGAAAQIAKSFGAKSAGAAAFSKALTAALKALPPDLTFQVYLDAAGHLRRLSISIPLGPMFTAIFSGVSGVPAGEASMLKGMFANVQEALTMDLTDYGAAVHVTAPPASQVVHGAPPAASGSSSVSSSASQALGVTGVTGSITTGSTGMSVTTSTAVASGS